MPNHCSRSYRVKRDGYIKTLSESPIQNFNKIATQSAILSNEKKTLEIKKSNSFLDLFSFVWSAFIKSILKLLH